MESSVYILFGLSPEDSPHEILRKCKQYCSRWTMSSVKARLSTTMSAEEAAVNVGKVFNEGELYLKSAAAMLLDPSARQCYDAWLDALRHPSPEKKKLTRSRLLWFNDTESRVYFSESMLKILGDGTVSPPPKIPKTSVRVQPQCRVCRCCFKFSEQYLVLHCHCTTRVGHVECLNDFVERVNNKCPVCRQHLLKRNQVSKYLFWNVKEKYKFIA